MYIIYIYIYMFIYIKAMGNRILKCLIRLYVSCVMQSLGIYLLFILRRR